MRPLHECSAKTCAFDVFGLTFICRATGQKHECGVACELRAQTPIGIACPVSGRFVSALICNPSTSEIAEEVPDSINRRNKRSIVTAFSSASREKIEVYVARLLPADVVEAYSEELARLREYTNSINCSISAHVVGTLYIMREGLAFPPKLVVAEPNSYLQAHLPHPSELAKLQLECGEITIGKKAWRAFFQRHSPKSVTSDVFTIDNTLDSCGVKFASHDDICAHKDKKLKALIVEL